LQQAGYHSANVDTNYKVMKAEALANLASAMQADWYSVAQLTKSNHSFTNQLTASYKKLDASLADIAALKQELAQLKASNFRNRLHIAPHMHHYFNQNYC